MRIVRYLVLFAFFFLATWMVLSGLKAGLTTADEVEAEAWSFTADAENDIQIVYADGTEIPEIVMEAMGGPWVLDSNEATIYGPYVDTEILESSAWIIELDTLSRADIQIGDGPGAILLNFSDSGCEVVGDPNYFSEAAKLFLDCLISEATFEQWAADGTICEAIGHRWEFLWSRHESDGSGEESQQCMICEKEHSRQWSAPESRFTDLE